MMDISPTTDNPIVLDNTSELAASTNGTVMATENIKIFLRVRPFLAREDGDGAAGGARRPSAVQLSSDGSPVVSVISRGQVAEVFEYDAVGGPETPQEEVFETVAQPITENCLQGYNGTIFAYGQTGSGKTFTMQGGVAESVGLIPRTLEYLFSRISEESSAEFDCKCSYIEIYNEAIYDLLDCSGMGKVCNLREDSKRGNAVFVEDCTLARVKSPLEALELFALGSQNRHVASTAMNRESSRSHAVFTIHLQGRWREGELLDVRESRFNLVDLAGSERQQLTGTVGVRLKEAGNINKSLLALSNVINALVETAGGRPRHVHYRDSKLTFLLKDSLGGNSKTCIVACVSPSPFSLGETLSTLRFAQRAKLIRNQCVMNKDLRGDTHQLQTEIRRLQTELANIRTSMMHEVVGGADPKILRIAMERQTELSNEVMKLKEMLEGTEELCRRKDYQIHAERMLRKLREAALSDRNPADDSEEVNILQGMIDHHPDVVRFALDNTRLRERLGQLDQLTVADFDALQSQLQRQQTHIDLLTQQILQRDEETENIDAKRRRLSTDALADARLLELQSQLEGQTDDLNRLRERVNDLETIEVDLRQVILHREKERGQIINQKEQLEKENNDQKSKIEELISEIQSKDQIISQLQESRAEAGEILANLKNQLVTMKEGHQNQLDQVGRLHQSKLDQLTAMAASEKEELSKQFSHEMTRLRDTVAKLEQSLAQSQLNVGTMASDLEAARTKIRDLQTQLQSQSEQPTEAKTSHDSEEMYVMRLELAHLRKTISDWETKYKAVSGDLQDKENQLNVLESSMKNSEASINELTAKLQDSNQALQSAQAAAMASPKSPRIDETRHKLVLAENLQHLQKINKLEHMLRHATEELASATAHPSANTQQRLVELEQELAALRAERDSLQEANAKLIQHHNAKQKLHYHVKIKEENNQLRTEIQALQSQLAKYMDST